jgi:hypothetical protein
MFAGVMAMPSAFSLAIAASGEYAGAYAVAGLLAAGSGLLLLGGGATASGRLAFDPLYAEGQRRARHARAGVARTVKSGLDCPRHGEAA